MLPAVVLLKGLTFIEANLNTQFDVFLIQLAPPKQ